MILAAAEAAIVKEERVFEDGGWVVKKKRASPPYELKLAWQCKQFNCLPYQGGLLNQPIGLIDKMQTAYNVWNAINMRDKFGSEQDKFIKDYPDEFEICEMVRKLKDGE